MSGSVSPQRKRDAEPSPLVPTSAKRRTEQILADVPLRGRGNRNLPRYIVSLAARFGGIWDEAALTQSRRFKLY